jgi:carboxypeptidase C (cathepsin A)
MLSEAMRHNPHLRVYVACGYFDGATPFSAAEYAFAHVDIPDELRSQIAFEYFEAGHMMYVHQPSRLRLSASLADFVRSAPSA